MLCCINGDFGKRFADVAISNGKMIETIEPPLGEPITPDLLDDKLSECPDVEAGWIARIEPKALNQELKNLMTAEQYAEYIEQLLEKG